MIIFTHKSIFVWFLTQIDKKVITKIATGDKKAEEKSLLKIWCDDKSTILGYPTVLQNVTYDNGTTQLLNVTDYDDPEYGKERCK